MPTGSPEQARDALDRGAHLITAGNDHAILLQGFQRAFSDISRIKV